MSKGQVSRVGNSHSVSWNVGPVTIAVLVTLLLPVNCYAYIDPNAAGWLFQLLFPLLVAIAGLWAVVRHRVTSLWRRIFPPRNNGQE